LRDGLAAIVAGALALSACSETLTAQSVVSDLRVVAVRADPPTAAPGDTVLIDALVVDPFGEDRSLTRLWAACVNPPADNPARCLQVGVPTVLGEAESVQVQVPVDALADRESGVLGVLLYLCAGGTPTITDTDVECVGAGASQILAVKRVRIEATAANTNPGIETILLDGESFDEADMPVLDRCGRDCAPHVLTLRASPDAADTYDDAGTPRTEELVSSWLATSGDMEAPFGFGAETEVEWAPPDGEGLVLFWFALRDDRGGVAWAERQALVQ